VQPVAKKQKFLSPEPASSSSLTSKGAASSSSESGATSAEPKLNRLSIAICMTPRDKLESDVDYAQQKRAQPQDRKVWFEQKTATAHWPYLYRPVWLENEESAESKKFVAENLQHYGEFDEDVRALI